MIDFETLFLLHQRPSLDPDYSFYLEEGLIKSYPLDFVRHHIEKRSDFLQIGPNFDESSFKVLFDIGYKTKKQFIEDLGKWLFKFGYFVSQTKDQPSNQMIVSIEMKYPDKVNLKNYIKGQWYHITNSQNVENIKKIGLGPKGTTTSYQYPPDRVFVIYTESPNDTRLDRLAKDLYQKKYEHLFKTNNSRSIINWKNSNMVLLKIELPEQAEVYYDPMCERSSDYVAGFIHKSINPKYISYIREFGRY